jgi:hypothetical protein
MPGRTGHRRRCTRVRPRPGQRWTASPRTGHRHRARLHGCGVVLRTRDRELGDVGAVAWVRDRDVRPRSSRGCATRRGRRPRTRSLSCRLRGDPGGGGSPGRFTPRAGAAVPRPVTAHGPDVCMVEGAGSFGKPATAVSTSSVGASVRAVNVRPSPVQTTRRGSEPGHRQTVPPSGNGSEVAPGGGVRGQPPLLDVQRQGVEPVAVAQVHRRHLGGRRAPPRRPARTPRELLGDRDPAMRAAHWRSTGREIERLHLAGDLGWWGHEPDPGFDLEVGEGDDPDGAPIVVPRLPADDQARYRGPRGGSRTATHRPAGSPGARGPGRCRAGRCHRPRRGSGGGSARRSKATAETPPRRIRLPVRALWR